MEVKFISDLHLGHEKIALTRGFSSAEDFHRQLISNWNSSVNKNDVVYILGDTTMGKKKFYPILDELKGEKHVILENYSYESQHVTDLIEYVHSITNKEIYKRDFILTHFPIHYQELKRNSWINIHGHTHSNQIMIEGKGVFGEKIKFKNPRYINVCIDIIGLIPLSFSKILKNHLTAIEDNISKVKTTLNYEN